MADSITLRDFYREIAQPGPETDGRSSDHFNVFATHELYREKGDAVEMPYNRRTYYKVSLIQGRNRIEYADRQIETNGSALLFATPKVPYHYVSLDAAPRGYFCVFTRDFLEKSQGVMSVDTLPIFRPGAYPVFPLREEQEREVEDIFARMRRSQATDYAYKDDLLLNYLQELIHYGQQLQPLPARKEPQTGSDRLAALFGELLERQFPIHLPEEVLELRSPNDYAERLSVHVNHLNKALKERTGETTSAVINGRLIREAKILLRHSRWSVAEIGYGLGFREAAHFSRFFKKYTDRTPGEFRR